MELDRETGQRYPVRTISNPVGETVMSMRPTPVLTREGVQEILDEMRKPPADTPERRATFARAHAARFLVEQAAPQGRSRHP